MPSRTPRRASRKHRSTGEWAGRIALACGVAVLGYQSVAFSIGQVVAKSRPKVADAIVSYDGRLGAKHAAALATPTVTPAGRTQIEALSRAALRREPTAVLAAAALGFAMLARGNEGDARRLLTYAQMLSRRNVRAQLWSIEDAVARNNVAEALRWYDITLRTNPALGDVLYPVLTHASRDPAIRRALARTLGGKPAWSDSYVGYAAGQKDDPRSTAALFVALRAGGVAIPAPAQASVVDVLLEAGDADEAWRYYAAIRPYADRKRVRDPHFAAILETPSAFDWTTVGDNGIAASIQQTREGGVFEFSAPASVGGPMLRQVQFLPAGTYRLAGRSDRIAQDTRALPYWMLTCRNDGRELGRVLVPNSAQAGGMFTGTLTVPANCLVQTLTLFAQPSDAIGGIFGQIDRVTLERTG